MVLFEFYFQDCANGCPSEVTSVTTATPGFVVVGTTPALPVPLTDCPSLCTDGPTTSAPDGMEAALAVEVMSPSAPYVGTLTPVGHTS